MFCELLFGSLRGGRRIVFASSLMRLSLFGFVLMVLSVPCGSFCL